MQLPHAVNSRPFNLAEVSTGNTAGFSDSCAVLEDLLTHLCARPTDRSPGAFAAGSDDGPCVA
jgi:hypothetical protein